jgi:CheY-like chemotaxis protein
VSKSKLDIYEGLAKISIEATQSSKSAIESLCNFLVEEFELVSSALFLIDKNHSLILVGKSTGALKNLEIGETHVCKSCQSLISSTPFILEASSNCTVPISSQGNHEGCILIHLSASQNALVKISKQNAVSSSEKVALEKSMPLIGIIINQWLIAKETADGKTGLFAKTVSDTLAELKTYSNSIIGYTTIIANENLNSSQSEYITSVKRNAQNLLLSVNDLNELSKLEQGSSPLNLKLVNIAQSTKEITELFKGRLAAKKIDFDISISPEVDKQISVDDQKLRYVLTSLLFISYSLTHQGVITLKVSSAKNKIRFQITDSGKTFSSDIIEKFFEPFSLLKLDEFKNSSLTGLTLSLVKKYISLLGGDISVTSSSGKGNSLTFTIADEAVSEIENSIAQLPKPTSINKVLVIEDDYATSKLLSNYLTKWGYYPVIVADETQTFEIIENQQLLAIILDIELPNVNGLEFLKRIREFPRAKNVPVIVCSIEPEKQKAFLMGAVEYFVKPINYNFLVEVLTSYKLRKNSNILCVDDDLPTLNLIKQAIESVGFVAVAENISANVMDNIKDIDIDLAIIDLDMPTLSGFELIKLLKSEKRYANLPIIIYTGKENYAEDLKKIEGLFDDLLDKRSTNIENLADVINSMINRYETPPPVEEVISKDDVIKILLAEDYKHSQIIVTRLLKKNGFENVIVVENGEDAVNMAKKEKFNLILMDMQMPIMNGFEATERIRAMAEYKDVPVIALTAFAMKGDREKCLEAGATDYIPKPIDSKEFIEKVKYYTNSL